MFLKVKRLQQFEDLLLEANIIRFGDEFNDIANDTGAEEKDDQDSSDLWIRMDRLIDQLLDKNIIDLDAEINNPLFESTFGTERGRQITEEYLKYCISRIDRIKQRLETELGKEAPDKNLIDQLTVDLVIIDTRIDALEKIYLTLKQKEEAEIQRVADQSLNKIQVLRTSMESAYFTPIEVISSKVKANLSEMDAATTEEEKQEHAEAIANDMHTLNNALENFPPEIKEEVSKIESQIDSKVKNEVGDEKFVMIKDGVALNREEAVILKRIIELNYTDFSSTGEIERTTNQIAISISGLQEVGTRRRASSPETIQYLKDMLQAAKDMLMAKANDKTIQLDKTKGIHFDFNKKLKLYEKVQLPVTGKQIADASWIMKFRKGLMNLLLWNTAGKALTKEEEAFANFGKLVHDVYAKTLNKSAKLIGKALKGREGEMKADALSRMFIPSTAVLDEKPEAVKEEGEAPGVSFQTPASISGMGDIKPPTATSIGSGDNFNPRKSDKPKKKKHSMILGFADFVRENNNY